VPSLAAARIFNAVFAPSYTPLGVFVGDTAGIGRGIVETFARHTKGNAHILIVGRNRAAAVKIIATFPKPTNPGIAHEFIECDLTLLKNVQRACAEILVRFQRVNFLVLTAGGISLKGLDLTEEGVDRKMGLVTNVEPRSLGCPPCDYIRPQRSDCHT
jgi:NAD(P)-dependent dehydrogenase (short-subunit alcohol dehydrogenase family)